MNAHPRSTTLTELARTSDVACRAEAATLREKLSNAGAFEGDDDGSYAKRAEWMLYCALIVESLCRLPKIATLVRRSRPDLQELLHEAMLHFSDGAVAPWNIALVVEAEMSGRYKPRAGKAKTVYDGVTRSMARFRAATEAGEVLGSWLMVWSSLSALIAELLALMAGAGKR
jgi:hypothetical protein